MNGTISLEVEDGFIIIESYCCHAEHTTRMILTPGEALELRARISGAIDKSRETPDGAPA